MNTTIEWTTIDHIDSDAPARWKRQTWQLTRLGAAKKLYEILEQNVSPAVVEINETIKQYPFEFIGPDVRTLDEIRIVLKVTPVEHRHIVLPKVDTNMPPVASPTFLKRLRYAVTGRW